MTAIGALPNDVAALKRIIVEQREAMDRLQAEQQAEIDAAVQAAVDAAVQADERPGTNVRNMAAKLLELLG